MAWRPSEYFVEGVLDNTEPNKVTGWMKFRGLEEKVQISLVGNFRGDLHGSGIRLIGHPITKNASSYLKRFSLKQTGEVGDITAGLPPADYVSYPYIEWYGEENGRVVLELDSTDVEVLTPPISACESDPIDRDEQDEKMINFLTGIAEALNENS
jgi:hypothetical protein